MKKIKIISILAMIVIVSFIGCNKPDVVSDSGVRDYSETIYAEGQPPRGNWITPTIVRVKNCHPDGEADYEIKVHNDSTSNAQFIITYRLPDNNYDGYVNAPTEAKKWVTISDIFPLLEPNETRTIPIILFVPKDAKDCPPNWEFWISVVKQQKGNIETEMCCRWLIDMKG